MSIRIVSFYFLFFLIFFDAYLFNFAVGPLHITLLVLVLVGLSLFFAVRQILRKERLNLSELKFPSLFIGAWFVYAVLALGWAKDKSLGMREIYYFFLFLLLIYSLLNLLRENADRTHIMRALWWVGPVTLLICWVEIFTGWHLDTSRYVVEYAKYQQLNLHTATGFFYNENDLSLFLNMITPVYLVQLYQSPKLKNKFLNGVVLLLLFGVIYQNQSRLATIAFVIQILFFIYMVNKKLFVKCAKIGAVAIPALLILALIAFRHKLFSYIGVYAFEHGHGSDFSRVNLYMNALYDLYHSYFLGVGPGNFQAHIVASKFNTKGLVDPHNWWLEVLSNFGVLIFAGYVLFFGYLIRTLYKIYRANEVKNRLSLVFLVSLVGFIPSCLGPSSLFYFSPMWLFYGLILSTIQIQFTRNLDREKVLSSPSSKSHVSKKHSLNV